MTYIYIAIFIKRCRENCSAILSKKTFHVCSATKERHAKRCLCNNHNNSPCLHHNFLLNPLLTSLHDNKPVYRLQQQSIRRLAFVPPYSVFCSISFRCGGLSIERNQKPLAPEITLAATHHDRQKQVEVKRSSRVNPHEIRLFSGCPYAVVKQGTKKFTKNKPYKGFSRFRTDLSLVGLTCALYVLFLIVIMLHGHPFCYAAD